MADSKPSSSHHEKSKVAQNLTHDSRDHINYGIEQAGDDPQVFAAFTTLNNGQDAQQLPSDYHQYLLDRHGTVDLDPLPGYGSADPYNWPEWKKIANLVLVAFHAMMATLNAASIIPAFEVIAIELEVTIQEASYLTSIQIAVLGIAPLLWKPLSTHYGRRPVFLVSLLCVTASNIGCAISPNYSSMAACRALVAFFISPAIAVGSAVVTETFFKKDRARYMGVWTLLITLGVPVAPFIFGFVAYHIGYRWVYWILAIVSAVEVVFYAVLGPETRYIRSGLTYDKTDLRREYLTFRRIDREPLRPIDFIYPLIFFTRPSVLIPTISYSMVFCLSGVLVTVEIPELFAEKFSFNAQQLGLQFIGVIIGNIIGEQLGGILSDKWMAYRAKRIGQDAQPEYRLWLSYPGYLLAIVGLVVFLVQTEEAPDSSWNVTPIVGVAIASAGLQVATTVLITYSVDCYSSEAASVGVFINFVRQLWSFIGPFWFPPMFRSIGVANSAGVGSALMIMFSILPTIILQHNGGNWRRSGEQHEQ